MSGGGGGSQAPVNPVYTDPVNGMSFPDAESLNAEIAQRKQQEDAASAQAQQAAQAASDKAAADAAAKDAQDEADFQNRFTSAKSAATKNIYDYFTNLGYDPSKYAGQINDTVNREGSLVADKAATPASSFLPSAGADLVTQLQGGLRQQATTKINNAFAPTYADTNISDSWLDPAETPILSRQFDPLSDQLLNASKRGTLNDAGYQAALAALSGKQTEAKATLNSLGQNVLANDRNGVNDYITGAKNDAAGVDLNTGANFSADPYVTGASNLVSRYHDSFAGDLSNAVGSTSFADIGSLLNAGGAVQGAIDPNATGGAASGNAANGGGVSDAYIAQQALANQKRGIGAGGGF